MNTKVYCINCKYIKDFAYTTSECHYPLNLEIKDVSNAYQPNFITVVKDSKFTINKDNNCTWYKKKWYLFWKKP